MDERKQSDAEEEQKECPVCIEPFNRSSRKAVPCYHAHCNFQACKSCVRDYFLTSTKVPHCMECHTQWDDDFVTRRLNKAFMCHTYRKHREVLLADHEISKVCESMEQAAREKKARECEARLHRTINAKIRELNAQISKLKSQKDNQLKERDVLHQKVDELRTGRIDVKSGKRRKFALPCPGQDCRGFLSTQHKCAICNLFWCSKCLEKLGYRRPKDHQCDPGTVSTVAAIRKCSRPCPRCGMRISKISGCDQMWCIDCHTAFSWNTGRIDTGRVHNPHFFQFKQARQAQRNGPPRTTGDPCNTNHLPQWNRFVQVTSLTSCDEETMKKVSRLYQFLRHVQHVPMQRLRVTIRRLSDNERLRVRYILNDINKEKLGKQLFLQDRHRRRSREIYQIMELLTTVGRERVWSWFNSDENSSRTVKQFATKTIAHMRELCAYCNTQFKLLSTRHKVMTYTINLEHFTMKKTNASRET